MTKKKVAKKAVKKVKYAKADGTTVMVTPAQKRAYQSNAKKAVKRSETHQKAKRKDWHTHVSPFEGESYTIFPDGTRKLDFPKPASVIEEVRERIKHVRWLRKQKWWVDTPEGRKAQISWVRIPLKEGNKDNKTP